jgi:hypothetical protein
MFKQSFMKTGSLGKHYEVERHENARAHDKSFFSFKVKKLA